MKNLQNLKMRMMKIFYYQIKGKCSTEQLEYSMSNWNFPPIFSGKVEAENIKDAKLIIEEIYGKKFPLRVLKKDLDSNEFLLKIEELKEDSHYNRLFEVKICEECQSTFYIIDKYNDTNVKNKGSKFCSDTCYEEFKKKENENYYINRINENTGYQPPVIYKITNKNNNKSYIGKTTQIFTLRWYQHFFQTTSTKFHEEIKNTDYSDWLFEILEVIRHNNIPDLNKLTLERETFYINHYDTINNGYNTLISLK
jgi:hypothetical protein